MIVCAPSVPSSPPRGCFPGLVGRRRIPSHLLRWASRTAIAPSLICRVSFPDSLVRRHRPSALADQFRAVKVRPIIGGAGAVRMSSTPAEQPSMASKDGGLEKTTKTVNVVIKGKVQGVYYRNWTVDTAQQLRVNGWVRNLKDGSVEALFSGNSASVDSLIEKCHSGPAAARVSSVEVSPSKEESPQGFERKPTIW